MGSATKIILALLLKQSRRCFHPWNSLWVPWFCCKLLQCKHKKLLIKSELGWGRVGKKSTQTWKNQAEEFKFGRVVWEQSIQNYWFWFAITLDTALFKGHFINLHILAYAKTWKNSNGTNCPFKTKNWKGYSILV